MAAEPRAFLPLTKPDAGAELFAGLRSARRADVATDDHVRVPPDRVGVVLRGAIVTECRSEDGTRFVDILGPEDLFGDGSFLARGPWTAMEHRALVPARTVSMATSELWTLAGVRPEVSRLLVLALARSGERLRLRTAILRTLPVADRVLAILVELARRFGRPGSDGSAIPLPLTQELVASLCGASRESVNRALAALRGRGAVRRAGGVYVVSAAAWSPTSANAPAPSPGSVRATLPSRSSLSR